MTAAMGVDESVPSQQGLKRRDHRSDVGGRRRRSVPSQQGLKPGAELTTASVATVVDVRDPSQQGLKHWTSSQLPATRSRVDESVIHHNKD